MRSLTFDSVLTGSSQPLVFQTTRTLQLLQDALNGYSVTIFAHGQVGAPRRPPRAARRAPRSLCRTLAARHGCGVRGSFDAKRSTP